nr:MAG TPA: Glutathione synthetase-like effector [Caudoviricetes sp.]DAS14905.1 MAG TPA: Glutathione synthetase-like effector [Caudoviricetes sp.]
MPFFMYFYIFLCTNYAKITPDGLICGDLYFKRCEKWQRLENVARNGV